MYNWLINYGYYGIMGYYGYYGITGIYWIINLISNNDRVTYMITYV